MPVTFNEALKELLVSTRNTQVKRIKLVNGEVLEGTILNVQQEMFEISMPNKGAGRPKYTVPIASILYISDCELLTS